MKNSIFYIKIKVKLSGVKKEIAYAITKRS